MDPSLKSPVYDQEPLKETTKRSRVIFADQLSRIQEKDPDHKAKILQKSMREKAMEVVGALPSPLPLASLTLIFLLDISGVQWEAFTTRESNCLGFM